MDVKWESTGLRGAGGHSDCSNHWELRLWCKVTKIPRIRGEKIYACGGYSKGENQAPKKKLVSVQSWYSLKMP